MKIIFPASVPHSADRDVRILSSTLRLVTNEPLPVPYDREVLVRVVACSVNRVDLMQAQANASSSLSLLSPPTSHGLGIEVAGIIMAIGSGCTMFNVDDEVCALLPGGGYAEYAVCDERTVIPSMRFKHSLTIHQIAAIPEAFMTAYQLLFFVAQLETIHSPSPAVLVHAAASSVGQALIQIGRRAKFNIFATAREASKCDLCVELGAKKAFLLKDGEPLSFANQLKTANEGKGCDLILCPVGSTYLNENIESLNVDGKIILYGLMGGAGINDEFVLRKIMTKRISLVSSILRSRDIEYKARLIRDLSTSDYYGEGGVFGSIARGDIKVNVDSVFEFEDVAKAHELMSQNKNSGKIILNTLSSASGLVMMKHEVDQIVKRMSRAVKPTQPTSPPRGTSPLRDTTRNK